MKGKMDFPLFFLFSIISEGVRVRFEGRYVEHTHASMYVKVRGKLLITLSFKCVFLELQLDFQVCEASHFTR